MTKQKFNIKKGGFTLAEVIVAMAITGILMIGISTFFTSAFSNIFRVQNESAETQKQFTANEIIREKFTKIKDVVKIGSSKHNAILLNKPGKKELPFSYIGKDTDKLVFKDFLAFSKMTADNKYANSGDGKIETASGNYLNPLVPTEDFKNFSSFAINNNTYYVVLPFKNKVQECTKSGTNLTCKNLTLSSLTPTTLNTPTDIELDKNGDNLFISDSGNGRVIKYDISQQTSTIIASPLKYPTGLSNYYDGINEWLFIADTFDNKVWRVKHNGTNMAVIAGAGEDKECDNITSRFCKLNMPTGIFAKHNDGGDDILNISDSGNNRILQIKDPGKPTEITFDFNPKENYKLDRLVIDDGNLSGGDYDNGISTLIGKKEHYDNVNNTFSNPGRLTVYSVDSDILENPSKEQCKTGTKFVYVNENPNDFGIESQNKLFHKNNLLSINSIEQKECKLSLADPSLPKYKITFNNLPESPQHNDTLFPATPDKITIKIDNNPTINSGFQNFSIKIYDIDKGLVHTEEITKRINDGTVGSDEDTIKVLVKKETDNNISFPTGLTNKYFVNSGKETINNIDGNTAKTLNILDTDINKFDYTSDFDLDGDPKFSLFNSDKILELELKAKISEEKSQSYTINSAISD